MLRLSQYKYLRREKPEWSVSDVVSLFGAEVGTVDAPSGLTVRVPDLAMPATAEALSEEHVLEPDGSDGGFALDVLPSAEVS